jgi:hypothetical protein
MSARFRTYSWIAISVIVLCAAVVALFQWRRSFAYEGSRLLLSLPLDDAVKVYIDADALRAAKLLDSAAGSPASEEPDYRRFVEETGFDYRRDLNAAAASFLNGDAYIAVRGHFDWKRLSEYARSQHGQCSGSFCSMPASRPDRSISFYLLRPNVLALAVAADGRAAARIMIPRGDRKTPDPTPAAPVWISAPGAAFRDLNGLPDGSHILSPLADAQEASFSLHEGHLQLDASCASPEIAASVVVRFTATTDLLRKMLQRDKLAPSPADLSGVLVAGRFETRASHAIGTWPLQKEFIESLLGGAGR